MLHALHSFRQSVAQMISYFLCIGLRMLIEILTLHNLTPSRDPGGSNLKLFPCLLAIRKAFIRNPKYTAKELNPHSFYDRRKPIKIPVYLAEP